MDVEAFIHWALGEQRTLEERYLVECMVEDGVRQWHRKRQNYHYDSEKILQKRREQSLNPAYLPDYSEETLRMAAESMPDWKEWSARGERPVRNVAAFAFFPNLESISLALYADVVDLTPLTHLPKLRKLSIGSQGHLFGGQTCEDYTPLARCTSLREVSLSFAFPWPDFTGIEALDQLEVLHLTGNLLALPRDVTFPKVRIASLYSLPLAMRDVCDMPNLPACEFLTLSGAGSLRGIEKMPCLRNLVIKGAFKSYEPLTALPNLTCLQIDPEKVNDPLEHPDDLTPINRIPGLLFYQFGRPFAGFDLPHDYSQLTDSPTLREIFVQGCPHVDMEVASVNMGLPSWDDLLLAPTPKPYPAHLRFVIAPDKAYQGDLGPADAPDDLFISDPGLVKRRTKWLGRYGTRTIAEKLGNVDWGHVRAGENQICINLECYEVVERLPEILEATRQILASLRHQLKAQLWIQLRIPPPEPSDALKELEKELRKRRDDWEDENRQRERQNYVRDLHRLQLKEQEGAVIDPDEFSPEEAAPYPQMEDLLEEKEKEKETEDGNGEVDVFVAVETEYKKAAFFEQDDAHPLADSYNLIAQIYFDAVHFHPQNRDIAIHLMARQPDIDLPDEETKPAA